MAGIRALRQRLKTILPPKRYCHSLSVAAWAQILARVYQVDQTRAYLTGLVHDCARGYNHKQLWELLRHYQGRYFDKDTKANPALWHNPAGVLIAKRDYAINNPFVLRAVALHSTGDAGMRILDKIVYVADYSEPNRLLTHAKEIRKIAMRDLDQAVRLTVNSKISYLKQTNKIIHPRSIALANWIKAD